MQLRTTTTFVTSVLLLVASSFATAAHGEFRLSDDGDATVTARIDTNPAGEQGNRSHTRVDLNPAGEQGNRIHARIDTNPAGEQGNRSHTRVDLDPSGEQGNRSHTGTRSGASRGSLSEFDEYFLEPRVELQYEGTDGLLIFLCGDVGPCERHGSVIACGC